MILKEKGVVNDGARSYMRSGADNLSWLLPILTIARAEKADQ